MTTLPSAACPETERLTAHRLFNLCRLLVVGLLATLGPELGLASEAPQVLLPLALIHAAGVVVTSMPQVRQRLGFAHLITVQFVFDFCMLGVLMAISGGYVSGIPVLLMVFVAAGSLLAEGRQVFFIAALAALWVLGENAWRTLGLGEGADWFQSGVLCAGFFAIALTARLLVRRAMSSESLAAERGVALDRQQALNERIIEDMHDGVLVLDGNGRVRQFNPRAAELLGVRLRVGDVMHSVDSLFDAIKTTCTRGDGRLLRIGPGGRRLRCRAVRTERDAAEVLVYLTDFEEVQRHIQQHKLAALGRLTASMAHEIRNPLNAVSQAAELLGEERRSEGRERLVRIIHDNTRRLERMVRDVLALGRRDAAIREPLPLAATVATLAEEFGLVGGVDARAVFEIEIPDGLVLLIDRTHFQQILSNLLENAVRHSSGAPGAVRIAAETVTGGRVALHIVDDGPGIVPEWREHVFDPFFTRHPKGTGLGLYIARELAEANDASLELLPDTRGAHFVLTGRRRA